MRFERLEVEHVRMHDQPRAVDLGPRITVIHGANEVGKSTLMDAVRCAVVYDFGSTAEPVQRLAPWGTHGVAPSVVLTYFQDGARYRLTKRWISSASVAIEREAAGGGWSSYLGGRDADEHLRQLLASTPPGRAADPFNTHGGLAQLLFVPQRELVIPKDGLNEGARGLLREVIGAVTEDARAKNLRRTILQRYAVFFTPAGSEAKNSPLAAARREAGEAEGALAVAREEMRRFEELDSALRENEGLLSLSERDLRERQKERDALEPQAEQARQARERVTEAERAFDAAKEKVGSLERQAKEIKAAEGDLTAAQADQRLRDEVHQKAVERSRTARERLMRAREGKAQLDQARDRLQELERRSERHAKLRDAEDRIRDLSGRLDQVASEVGEVEGIKARLDGIAPVDEGAFAELRLALEGRDNAANRIAAAALQVTLSPVRGVKVRYAGTSTIVSAGEDRAFSGEGRLEIEIVDVGRITAAGPTKDVRTERARHRQAEQRIEELGAALGSRDVVALEARLAERRALEGQRREREAAIQAALGGMTRDDAQAQLNVQRATRDTLLAEDPGLERLDPAVLQRELEESRAATEAKGAELLPELEAAEKLEQTCLVDEQTAANEVHRAQTTVAAAAAKLAGLRRDRPAEDLQREHVAAHARLQLAEEELGTARAARDALGEVSTAEERHAVVQREIDDLHEDIKRLQKERGGLDASLKTFHADSPVDEIAHTEARLAQSQRALERHRLEADALKLLHQLLANVDRERQERFVGPLRSLIRPWYREITGRELESFEMSDSYAVTRLRLGGGAEPSPAELSTGTQDQLALVTRLGLTAILAERQQDGMLPLVLDDPLVHADRLRLDRALRVLCETAEHLQLIVLTCNPLPYRALGAEAQFVEIAPSR